MLIPVCLALIDALRHVFSEITEKPKITIKVNSELEPLLNKNLKDNYEGKNFTKSLNIEPVDSLQYGECEINWADGTTAAMGYTANVVPMAIIRSQFWAAASALRRSFWTSDWPNEIVALLSIPPHSAQSRSSSPWRTRSSAICMSSR